MNDSSSLANGETETTPFITPDIDNTTCLDHKQPPNDGEAFSNPHSSGSNFYTYFLTGAAALGGFLFGYDTGVISGAMLAIKASHTFDPLTDLWQESIVSITIFGAILGSILAGALSDRFGRRVVLIAASAVFTVGAIGMAAANSKLTLAVGRLVVGIGIGLASSTVPVYIAEASPAHRRGTLVTVNGVFITFGQFVASVIDGVFSYDEEHGWRYMLGLSGVPSVLMLIGMVLLPESPRWLMKNNRLAESKAVLTKLRGGACVEEEYNDMRLRCEDEMHQVSGSIATAKRVLSTYYTRRAVIIGCCLQAIQQLSGINTVMYYSATIISFAGVSDVKTAIWMAAAVAFGNFFFALIPMILADRVGRRRLMLFSVAGVVVALIVLASTFLIAKQSSPLAIQHLSNGEPCAGYDTCYYCIQDASCSFCSVDKSKTGACLLTTLSSNCSSIMANSSGNTHVNVSSDVCPSSAPWLAVLALVFYLAMFSPGLGPLTWTINSEIFPLWARSTGAAFSTTTNWTFNLLVSMTFLHLMMYLTRAGAFLLYAAFTLVGFVFLYLFLPETAGCKLENVESLFKGSFLVRKHDYGEIH